MQLWIVPSFENPSWSIIALSFISLLGVTAVLATCFFVRRHRFRTERSLAPRVREFHGISSRLVKAMPSLIFTAVLEDNCTSQTCAICLEDYSVGEKLRVLPCRHSKSWTTLRISRNCFSLFHVLSIKYFVILPYRISRCLCRHVANIVENILSRVQARCEDKNHQTSTIRVDTIAPLRFFIFIFITRSTVTRTDFQPRLRPALSSPTNHEQNLE